MAPLTSCPEDEGACSCPWQDSVWPIEVPVLSAAYRFLPRGESEVVLSLRLACWQRGLRTGSGILACRGLVRIGHGLRTNGKSDDGGKQRCRKDPLRLHADFSEGLSDMESWLSNDLGPSTACTSDPVGNVASGLRFCQVASGDVCCGWTQVPFASPVVPVAARNTATSPP